jgi:hypothetical protein
LPPSPSTFFPVSSLSVIIIGSFRASALLDGDLFCFSGTHEKRLRDISTPHSSLPTLDTTRGPNHQSSTITLLRVTRHVITTTGTTDQPGEASTSSSTTSTVK